MADINIEDCLQSAIQNFYEDKNQLSEFKKSTDYWNQEIKDYMRQLELTEFKTDDDIVAKIIIKHSESFMEDKLIERLKALGVTSAIKTIETVDYDELENCIYNGQINASELADCKQSKETESLTVKKK